MSSCLGSSATLPRLALHNYLNSNGIYFQLGRRVRILEDYDSDYSVAYEMWLSHVVILWPVRTSRESAPHKLEPEESQEIWTR